MKNFFSDEWSTLRVFALAAAFIALTLSVAVAALNSSMKSGDEPLELHQSAK